MTDVSAGFRACRPHTNLYKFGEYVSPHIFHKKNCCGLNLGESLCISTFFHFSDSVLNLLNGFDFFILIFFEWCGTENQQLQMTVKQKVYISYQTKAGSRSVVYDLGYEDILPKNMIFTNFVGLL